MTRSADRNFECPKCGQIQRAIHYYLNDEYYVVGGDTCENCGFKGLDKYMFDGPDNWTPED